MAGIDAAVGLSKAVTPKGAALPKTTEFTQLLADEETTHTDIANYLALDYLMKPLLGGAISLYQMSSALLKENFVAAREAAAQALAMLVPMSKGITSATRRAFQLAVKQLDFHLQQITRGLIETSSLSRMFGTSVQGYLVETVRYDADGRPLNEARVLAVEDYAKAAHGIAEAGSDHVVRWGCFAPGILVHTDRGLLPIEDIHIGMQVLSQPEDGGERGYRQVIHAVAHLDQPAHAVQVQIDGSEERTTVLATGNHPFWVEAPLVEEKHWMAAECLEPGFVVQLADGRKARIRATGIVRRTQYQKIGFAADDRSGIGMVFDLTEGIRLASDTRSIDSDRLELGEPFLTPVHNFEVDGFHTYYVGEAGVWVHNAECSKEVALESALREAEFVPRKTELESACFVGDTGILIEKGSGRVKGIGYDVTTIEEIWMAFAYYAGIRNWDDFDEWPEVSAEEAGFDWKVLSRDPRTGEMACKRILKVYNHGFRKVSEIYYKYGPKYLAAWENDTLPSQGSGQRTNILSGFRARAGFRCATCNPETNS